jgi:hypothetical protein
MKYLITESKLNSAIYEYIDELFHNGYDIRMEEAEDEDGNPIEYAYDFIQDNGDYGFLFTWTGKEYYDRPYNSSLFSKWSELAPIVEIAAYEKVDTLNNMFGDLWRPIFIKWFEDLFLLPIKTLK